MSGQIQRVTEKTASQMAEQLCRGFQYHDQRERERAIDAFAAVDTQQFEHVSEEAAREASIAYVDALWAKDEIERSCMQSGTIDREALDEADWGDVRSAFARRAELVGIDPQYADLSTVGWRKHKTGGDYWTPLQRAQMLELRAALQDPEYPHKPRYGQSGFGPEPAQYLLGVELHDMRRWEQAREAITPYFERILDGHADRD